MPHDRKRQKVSNEDFAARVEEIRERNWLAKHKEKQPSLFSDSPSPPESPLPPTDSRSKATPEQLRDLGRFVKSKFTVLDWTMDIEDPRICDPKIHEPGRWDMDKHICYSCRFWVAPGGCDMDRGIDGFGIDTMKSKSWDDGCARWVLVKGPKPKQVRSN